MWWFIVLALLMLVLLLFPLGHHLRTSIHVSDRTYDLFLSTLLSHSVPEVAVDRLQETGLHILDARTYREFEVSHIPGALWVGYEDFSPDRVVGIDKQASVAVYWAVGYRSERIAIRLRDQGYLNVVNAYGGIFEWVNTNHAVVTDDGSETERIHAYSRVWGLWLKQRSLVYD